MEIHEVEAEFPGLLAALSTCGIGTARAPAVLQRLLASLSVAALIDRKDLFRAVLKAARPALSPPPYPRLAELDMPYFATFETLEAETRLALLLLVILEFNLRDTAFILETQPDTLAVQLEHGLDDLEGAGSTLTRRRKLSELV